MIGHHHAFRVKKQMEDKGYKPTVLSKTNYSIFVDGHKVHKTFKVFGNTDEHAPVCYRNKIAIDGCTNLTGKVNVVVVEDYPLDSETPEKSEVIQDAFASVYTYNSASWNNNPTFTVRADINNTTFTI